MRTTLLCLLAAILIGPTFLVAQEPDTTKGLKAEAVALKIIRKMYGEGFGRLNPMHSASPGTTIAILIESPKGGLISILPDKSKLDLFADDKGTNLLGEKKFGTGIASFPRLAKDGKAGLVDITGKVLPASGATSIQAKGTITLGIATQKKKTKSKPFAVKQGTTTKIGDVNFLIKKAGKPSYGKEPLEITFETKDDVTAVAGYLFEDAAGKEIKMRKAGSSRSGFNKSYTTTMSFAFEKEVKELVLVMDAWQDKKEVPYKFDVSIGIGGIK